MTAVWQFLLRRDMYLLYLALIKSGRSDQGGSLLSLRFLQWSADGRDFISALGDSSDRLGVIEER